MPKLRLRWRRTWADRDNDFTAIDRRFQGTVGRIYLNETSNIGRPVWYWTYAAIGPGLLPMHLGPTGFADEPRVAAGEVELRWFTAAANIPDDAPDNSIGRSG